MIKIILLRTSKLFLIWFIIDALLIIAWLGGGNLDNRAVALATLTCGLLTFSFWFFGRFWINYLASRSGPKWLKVLTVGLLGAFLIEAIFWFWEQIIGAVGISINSDPFISLVFTLPTYIIFILLFWWVQKKYHYTTGEILVFGGIYRLGAEAIIGTLFRSSLFWGLLYGVIGLPVFMIVSSVMMLPLATLVKILRPTSVLRGERWQRWLWGLLPIIAFLPFILLYFII